MNKITANPLLSLGFALGTSAIAALPGMAQTPPTSAALLDMFGGNASAPGGIVTIPAGGTTQQPGFNFNAPNPFSTKITSTIGSETIVFSSLTAADWDTKVDANGKADPNPANKTLLDQWLYNGLKENYIANGLPPGVFDIPGVFPQLRDAFVANLGRERFSDPPIAYVSPVGADGKLRIGIAGFLNASDQLKVVVGDGTIFIPGIGTVPLKDLVPAFSQANELLRVDFRGETSYLYRFPGPKTTNSGQSLLGTDFNPICVGGAATNTSDPKAQCPLTGNYEFEFPVTGIPEGTSLTNPTLTWQNPQSFPFDVAFYELACPSTPPDPANTVSPTYAPCNTPDYNNGINPRPPEPVPESSSLLGLLVIGGGLLAAKRRK